FLFFYMFKCFKTNNDIKCSELIGKAFIRHIFLKKRRPWVEVCTAGILHGISIYIYSDDFGHFFLTCFGDDMAAISCSTCKVKDSTVSIFTGKMVSCQVLDEKWIRALHFF